jgi:hypothetical protein
MAYDSFLLGYRMESTEDLLAEKAALKAQQTIFSQQGMGTKSLTRDLRLLEDKLQAINFVLAERGYVVVPPTRDSAMTGVTDFSKIQ